MNTWYDNGSDTFLNEGDIVIWENSTEEIEGLLMEINEKTFIVKWEDGKTITYKTEDLDGIKKLE